MPEAEGNGRVSVSRDALRADLLDLELRLTKTITSALAEKADRSDFDRLTGSLNQVVEWRLKAERGEFTRAQEQEVISIIHNTLKDRGKEAWTTTSRRLAILGAFVTVIGLFSSISYVVFNVVTSG